MTPQYDPGDILQNSFNQTDIFHVLVMDIEKVSECKGDSCWPFDVYVLLDIEDGEIFRVSIDNVDGSSYFNKVA